MTLTRQKTFDIVAEHLLTQNRKCENSDTCLYRKGQMACAIGALIPNRLYKKDMESQGVAAVLQENKPLAEYMGVKFRTSGFGLKVVTEATRPQFELLQELQCVHDDNRPSEWKAQLAELAEEKGFKTTVFGRAEVRLKRTKAARKAWKTRRAQARVR